MPCALARINGWTLNQATNPHAGASGDATAFERGQLQGSSAPPGGQDVEHFRNSPCNEIFTEHGNFRRLPRGMPLFPWLAHSCRPCVFYRRTKANIHGVELSCASSAEVPENQEVKWLPMPTATSMQTCLPGLSMGAAVSSPRSRAMMQRT